MSTLIHVINAADAIACLHRQGLIPALIAVERIVALGFYAVRCTDSGIVGYYEGVRFEL